VGKPSVLASAAIDSMLKPTHMLEVPPLTIDCIDSMLKPPHMIEVPQTPMAQGRSTKIIQMISWIRNSRSLINNLLALPPLSCGIDWKYLFMPTRFATPLATKLATESGLATHILHSVLPHGGLRSFPQTSTCLTQFALEP